MTNQDLIIYHKSQPSLRLNEKLIEKQGLTEDQVSFIKLLHSERFLIEDRIKESDDPKTLRKLAEAWHQNQFALQEAWRFKRDIGFHKFWELPKCSCAKLDNDDAYPTGYYSVSGDCPLHGDNNV